MRKYVILTVALFLNFSFPVRSSVSVDESAKPWVFWYWMHGALTKPAITADLESMKEAGLGGAYIFAIKDVTDPPLFEPSYRTLTPEWWDMVKHAMSEAARLGLELGMNSCDGFTAAGGPWITPEQSMQKVVWKDTLISGPQTFSDRLPQPEKLENYYQDIAVFAYPAPEGSGQSSYMLKPKVTSSIQGKDVQFLADPKNKSIFNSDRACWIQYEFEEAFTCRSLTLKTGWNNYQANRLIIQTSTDGVHFTDACRLEPPRLGWLDLDAAATHRIPELTSRFFRFVFDPEGSEPGAEDLDDAKWKPALKIAGIELSGETKIGQFEGKSGAIWRIARRDTEAGIPVSACIDPEKMIRLSTKLSPDGRLTWEVPAGDWVILRMGHTSTGHVNYIGGAGKGLECDKLNPEVVRFQFDQWFGEAFRQVGPELASNVLKRFHVDSWECGSQNWSPVFQTEFIKRRGYDLVDYLPVMAGIPVRSAGFSERVLADVRETLSELITENFYKILADEAHQKGCLFSAESVAPVMAADGMLHMREVDLPMGEFWLRSPSHDKPNDILDAVSGAHIYGKNLVQAESFTEIRIDWDEHPGMLKPVADQNFALGINKLFFHVMTLNPWTDRKPGMTLDKVGTYFQRDQCWWKPGKAFVDYLSNCQHLLQQGIPVVDIAVFTGEEIPRRAVLPDRLVEVLPGIFGAERVEQERIRLQNEGLPMRELPAGVRTQANMADPENWIDPLRGYAYDSFNRDALLHLAKVENGRIVLPGGASYGLLVIPGNRRMAPHGGELMSVAVAQKLLELVNHGAKILMMQKPVSTPGWDAGKGDDLKLKQIIDELYSGSQQEIKDLSGKKYSYLKKGKGMILTGPFEAENFDGLDLRKDFSAADMQGKHAGNVAWNHRTASERDIYFVANQSDQQRLLSLSFRIAGLSPELYNPVTNETHPCADWKEVNGLTILEYQFEANESLFVIFRKGNPSPEMGKNWIETVPVQELKSPWSVQFDAQLGGPSEPVDFPELYDWSKHADERIRFYSGTAMYRTTFQWTKDQAKSADIFLELGKLSNLAEVKLNGQSCGIGWTAPFRVRISEALKDGANLLEISVTNTWTNRLIGDHGLPEEKRIAHTTAPYRLEGKPLLPAGLFGPVKISLLKNE